MVGPPLCQPIRIERSAHRAQARRLLLPAGLDLLGADHLAEERIDVAQGRIVRGLIVGSDRIPLDSLLQARSICNRGNVWLRRFSVGLTALDVSVQHAHSIEFDNSVSA